MAGTLATPFSAAARGKAGESVEIRRDDFGAPYISSQNETACIFGLGYAQAEDGLAYLEDCYLRALGRGAEVHGEAALKDDRMVRALEIPKLSKHEFAQSPPHLKRIYRAFAAGIMRFASETPGSLARLGRVEPWHSLALLRYKYYVLEFPDYAGLTQADREKLPERPQGSNAWAIAPSRSASGNAMLLINPHVAFFGPARYYECTIQSSDGLRFQGITRYGLPLPYMGHNDVLGWAHTDDYPDFCDLYAEDIRKTSKGRAYRHGERLLPLREWTETIAVRVPDGRVEQRCERFQATHHGPIVGERNGKPLAIKMARLTEGGWFDQWYEMARARSLPEFRKAVARCTVPYMNIVYADRSGNIYYVYGGAVPKRDVSFDWSKPVDGADPRTEWHGYHSLEDLPQQLNPPSGFVQSCNSSPFTASGNAPDRRADYPSYLIGAEVDNLRAKRSREILSAKAKFTFESWTAAVTDSHLYAATEGVRELSSAWRALPLGERKSSLAPLIDSLASWNGDARVESIPTTLFVRWFAKRSAEEGRAAAEQMIAWLEQVRDDLTKGFGTWRVPWGEINRLQRVPWDEPLDYDDSRPSLPVRGAPGWTGVIFNFYTDKGPHGRRYGMLGNSYVSVVEFGAMPRARTILVFGQAMQPSSPHYLDQAQLYADGKFKPAWWSPADVAANAKPTAKLSFRGA